MKARSIFFAALAFVVMTSVFNPVGVPAAFAQSQVQVGGAEAQKAIDAALKANQITPAQAKTLANAVANQGATVAVDATTRTLVLGQNIGALAGLGAGFTGANVAVAAFIVAGIAVAVAGDGTTATTGTTGTN
jgi:hypothetical protein